MAAAHTDKGHGDVAMLVTLQLLFEKSCLEGVKTSYFLRGPELRNLGLQKSSLDTL